ncbi:hypothetical protein FVEN_g1411 [Fusarium venenatum]|uniref:uncharacterized protein n=1 Tax=Fusarium venenatum TaxID=56646 RepID=UPI001D1C0FA2|nr:hypothetical protein FVEN_g1411 [Fusarium venenatum]KAH6979931.1 hypothetical protein EDB82DRAFT_509679 [Fusarium venenatum]
MSTITPIHRSPWDVSLEFEEFDFSDSVDASAGKEVSDDHYNALMEVLQKYYKATDVIESSLFLVIRCQDGPPDEDKRPSSVAGAIAIWTDATNFGDMPFVVNLEQGDPIEVEDDFADQMLYRKCPSEEVILYLANLWPGCEAIYELGNQLVVELPLVSLEEHLDRLQSLDKGIKMGSYIVRFYNSPLPNSQRTKIRDIKQNLKKLLKSTDYDTCDLFIFDSSAVGRQVVACCGRRFTIGQKDAQDSESHGVVGGDKYIAFKQSALISNLPKSFKKLHDRGCHFIFLQYSKASLLNKWHRTPTMMMEEGGDVGVVLHLEDLQFPDNFKNYPYIILPIHLIDIRWTVVWEPHIDLLSHC